MWKPTISEVIRFSKIQHWKLSSLANTTLEIIQHWKLSSLEKYNFGNYTFEVVSIASCQRINHYATQCPQLQATPTTNYCLQNTRTFILDLHALIQPYMTSGSEAPL